jgi:hypothetical protein
MAGKKSDNGADTPPKKGRRTYALILDVSSRSATGGKWKTAGTTRFGSVQAKSIATDGATRHANIALGQAALKRAKIAFVKRGVSLRHRKDVPVFFADPREPSVLIRRLGGREERGQIVDGAFVPAE